MAGKRKKECGGSLLSEAVPAKKKAGGSFVKKASITIYLSLMLMLIVSVISASVLSVKVQAGRSRVANSVDQAMFSLFAQYDRDLFSKYDVFFIDGASGSGDMKIGSIYERLTDAMEYILKPNKGTLIGGRNLLSLSVTEGAITGYTLATDVNGGIYASQAVDYMKETAGIQLIALLLDKYRSSAGITEQQESQKDLLDELQEGYSYEDIEAMSGEARIADAEEAAELAEAGYEGPTEAEARAEAVPDDFVNPLPFIEELRRLSVYDLVLGTSADVSEKELDGTSLVSSRGAQSGVGIIDVPEGLDTFETGIIYNEYILTHFGNYTDPEREGSVEYQAEYILQGKPSDRENIEDMITKLLLAREASNLVFLYSSPTKSAELGAAAEAISILLYIPFAEPVIKALLASGWAFCESVVDVRALLRGKRIPFIKSDDNWQVQLASIPDLLTEGGIDNLTGNDGNGMNYTDYLRILLAVSDRQTHISRSLDLVESTIRRKRPGFRIDCCIESLTAEFSVRSENYVTLTEEETMRYRDFVKKSESGS